MRNALSRTRSAAPSTAEPPTAAERLPKVPVPVGTTAVSLKRTATELTATPSWSATIWANGVVWPCPCGDVPARRLTLPPGSTRAEIERQNELGFERGALAHAWPT